MYSFSFYIMIPTITPPKIIILDNFDHTFQKNDYNDFFDWAARKRKGWSKGRNNKKTAISTTAAEECGDEYVDLGSSFGDPLAIIRLRQFSKWKATFKVLFGINKEKQKLVYQCGKDFFMENVYQGVQSRYRLQRANISCVSVLCLWPLFSVFSMIFTRCYLPFSFLENDLEIYIPQGVQLVTNITTRWCICFPIVKQWDCSSTNWHKVELFPAFLCQQGGLLIQASFQLCFKYGWRRTKPGHFRRKSCCTW